jgi:hypothetical protein
MSEIEKNIAFKIAQQFPAYYRENGPELVKLVEEYYRFTETESNQSVYNARRMFEYRDIATTLSSMIIFFQKKYLVDLPLLDDPSVRFIIKNILDLYRRKGSEAGVILFFRMFYQEDVEIRYPAKYILKPSDSSWQTGTYLQLFPNNNIFYAKDEVTYYTYKDLISRDIYGSISKAKAIVDKINFILLNKTLTPIIYITAVKGQFTKFDDMISRIDGSDISFGKLNGSASSIEIDLLYGGSTGNKPGDVFSVLSEKGGIGAVAIVTKTQDEFTGTVNYEVTDGGFGYTIPDTKLLVSNQSIVLDNPDFSFVLLETLRDTAGNEGIVTGQNSGAVGVRMNAGEEFVISRPISTIDRDVNVTFTRYITGPNPTGQIFTISSKNETSPGPLLPENGNANTDVQVSSLTNIENISLITDIIQGYLNVSINAANYNDPPAAQPMSGLADPVNITTALDDAFDLEPFDIGTIVSFKNTSPGSDYQSDVFSLARDDVMIAFERFNQYLLIEDYSASFSVGDIVTQPSRNVSGIIVGIDNDKNFINIRPYNYYGFKSGFDVVHKGNTYGVLAVERDYISEKFGENADIKSTTQFSTGRISAATISNSGFGYVDGETVFLVNDAGEIQAKAILRANSQGITAGFWGSFNSHINGYTQTLAADGTDVYFDSKTRIQDSDYYQEYSYEIRSTIDTLQYEDTLKKNVHLAGTKMFGEFVYSTKEVIGVTNRFYRAIKEDNIIGGDPIVGPNQIAAQQTVRSDNNIRTADATTFTADIT